MNYPVLLPVVVAGFGLAVVALHRYPGLGVAVIALMTLTEWEAPAQEPVFSVAGSNVFPLDLLSTLMVVVAALNARRLVGAVGTARYAWYALSLLLLLGLARGIAAFGLATSVNEFRTFLYPMAVIAWAMSLDWTPQRVRRLIGTGSLLQGWALTVLAAVHTAVYGFGSADDEVQLGGGLAQTLRPLVSGQALTLLFCAVAVIGLAKDGRPWLRRISGAVFLVVVLLVQQRTVWAAGVAVVATVLLVGSLRQRRALLGVAAALLLAAAFALPAVLRTPAFADIVESSASSGTYQGRVTSWAALIGQALDRGIVDVLLGLPSGFGWGRFEGPGRWVEWPPHNWYVTVFLRAGAFGAVLLLVFLAIVVGRLLRGGGAATAATGMVIATIVYGWSYSWGIENAVLLGWAITMGVRRTGRRTEQEAPFRADAIGIPFSTGRDGFGSAT